MNHAVLPNEVHIWQAGLDLAEPERACLAATLSDDERARAERFHLETHRQRYVAGRGTLRALLSHYMGCPPSDLAFAYGTHGKPAVAAQHGQPDFHFNVSHSANVMLCALALGREVGVDVEKVDEKADYLALARRFFSSPERIALETLAGQAGLASFYALWTCKEALLKGLGMGLLLPLDAVDVSQALSDAWTTVSVDSSQPRPCRWSVHHWALEPGFAAAMAIEGERCTIVLRRWGTADERVRGMQATEQE